MLDCSPELVVESDRLAVMVVNYRPELVVDYKLDAEKDEDDEGEVGFSVHLV